MRNLAGFIAACLIFVLVCVLGVKFVQQNSASSSGNRTNTSEAQDAQTPVYTANNAGLEAVQAALNNSSLDTSVSITDLQTGKTYHYGETASYTAASVGKLVTAVTYLNKVENGDASLDDLVEGVSARSQLEKMIVKSDNVAWLAMEHAVTLSAQQAYARRIGLTGYNAEANTMTTDDVATLLAKLSSAKLVGNDNTQLLLSYMEQANYRAYIVAAVPSGVTVYHKVGLLEDRLLDVAIIKKGDRSYVLAIFSKSNSNYPFSQGVTLFGSITEATLQAFFKQS